MNPRPYAILAEAWNSLNRGDAITSQGLHSLIDGKVTKKICGAFLSQMKGRGIATISRDAKRPYPYIKVKDFNPRIKGMSRKPSKANKALQAGDLNYEQVGRAIVAHIRKLESTIKELKIDLTFCTEEKARVEKECRLRSEKALSISELKNNGEF